MMQTNNQDDLVNVRVLGETAKSIALAPLGGGDDDPDRPWNWLPRHAVQIEKNGAITLPEGVARRAGILPDAVPAAHGRDSKRDCAPGLAGDDGADAPSQEEASR